MPSLELASAIPPFSSLQSTLPVATLSADIILGSPRSGCQGVGICHINAPGVWLSVPCQAIRATLVVTSEGRLSLWFRHKAVQLAGLGKHFAGQVFHIEVAYRLPLPVVRRLPMLRGIWLLPGTYSVMEKGDWLVVSF